MKRYLLSITPKDQRSDVLVNDLNAVITALREQADTLASGKYGNAAPHGRMDTSTADVEWITVKDEASGPMNTERAAPEL